MPAVVRSHSCGMGTSLRSAIAEDLGHSAADRRRSAMRNARLCQLLAEQGTDVVMCHNLAVPRGAALESLKICPGYREIYVRVPLHELKRRDTKGIYARAQTCEARDVVGIDLPVEAPETPDLVLDNYGALDVSTAVDRILAVCDRLLWNGCQAAWRASSPSKPRLSLWKCWRRCCRTHASCRRSDVPSAIGARTPPRC